ncbi:MAG: hypothetical protein LBN34_09750 [Clostridiales Family XIII bacterium]|jgi:hypothetical protein|nr:hypothetical protein [Clostridiales Family XIII bacterium]
MILTIEQINDLLDYIGVEKHYQHLSIPNGRYNCAKALQRWRCEDEIEMLDPYPEYESVGREVITVKGLGKITLDWEVERS